MKNKIVNIIYQWRIIIFLIVGYNQYTFSQWNVVQAAIMQEGFQCVANMPPQVFPTQSNFTPCDEMIGWVALDNFTISAEIKIRTRLFINGNFQWEYNWPETSNINVNPGGWVTHCVSLNQQTEGNYLVEYYLVNQNTGVATFLGSATSTVAHHPDYAPLMALYNSTNGPGWSNNTGWVDGAAMTNCDPCNGWYGVTCSGGRVNSVDLEQNGLSGIIPSTIDALSSLSYLRLSYNSLVGNIPNSISNLSNLTSLLLHHNQLSGNIPTDIDNLTNLHTLNLSVNSLSGVLPNFNFQLMYLILHSNQLSGEIPDHLGSILTLQMIHFSGNSFNGSIPFTLGNLLNLNVLLLTGNNLSGCIPEELQALCPNVTGNNGNISNNPLLSTQSWDNFCNNQEGMCIDCPGFTFEITGPSEVCTGSSLTLDAGSYSEYLWSNGATTQTINPSNITVNTTYTVTVTDNNGCTGTDSHTVSVNQNPSPSITGPNFVCSGGSVTLDAGTYSSYNWSTGANAQTININNITTPTTYTVTVTDTNGCTGSDEHHIIVNANPIPTITGATSACVGELVTLDAGSGYASYDWSTGESSPSITVSPSAPTTYTVAVSDGNGCTGTDTHIIDVLQNNTYQNIAGGPGICPGFNVYFEWSTTGATGINPIIIPNGLTATFSGGSSSGVVTLQGIVQPWLGGHIDIELTGGCGNIHIWEPFVVFEEPQIQGETDGEFCPNVPIFDMLINVTDAVGIGNPFNLPPGLSASFIGNVGSGIVTISGVPLQSGVFNYNIPLNSICSGSITGSIVIHDSPTYTFDPSNLKICQDSLITLNSPDLDNFSLVNMVPRNGLSAMSTWNELAVNPTLSTCTNCVFDLYITDGNNCSIQSIHTLTFSKSIVQSTTQVSTQGGSDGTATIQMLNGSRPYTVRVNNGNPQVYQNTPFTIPNLTEGSYSLVVTDYDGCTTTASFVINGIDCPMTVSDSIEHIACYGDSTGRILLIVSGNEGNISYLWQNNLGTSNILDSLNAGMYSVTLSDDNCSIIKSYTVLQPIQPLSLNASLTHPGCGISDGSININAIGGWMPYDTIHPDTMLINQERGTYPFYVIDSLGCRFDFTFTLLVTPGLGDFPVFRNSPQNITISCANAPEPDYIPILAYGYPNCGLDSVGFVSASVTKVGDICAGQTITFVWVHTDAFGHTISHIQIVQILPPPTPAFISPPADITINYSNLAQMLQPVTLIYSNNEAGNCMIAGIAMPTTDSSGLMDCSGIVTKTWKAMFCNGLDSIMYVQNITVEKDDILPPVISCAASNENSITFGWTSVPGATGYNVEVISPVGLQGTWIPGQNQYQFGNLNTGQSVTIQVEALIPGVCGNVVSLPHTCTALDCGPLPDVLIDIPVSFCVNDQPFTLNASQVTINPPIQNSTGSFEINGTPITQINPSQLGPGTHTLFYRLTWNSGQCSQVGARDFVIYPLPSADFSLSSVNNCITDPITVTYAGNPDGTTFTWDFGSDVVGSFSGPGPHQVSWANPGSKAISLSVSKNGCNSFQITKALSVNPTLLPPVITCLDQKFDGVTFGWNPVNGANSYDIRVNVNGVILYQGNVTNTTYVATGLQEGSQVQIFVTARSNNACSDVTSQLICIAESCPNARLTIPDRNINQCLTPASTPIPLLFSISDNIPNESPTIRWSSSNTKANNAINNNTIPPTFDPLIAGVGEYFVKLSYQQKSCIWEDSILISIKAKPTTTSIISKDSICISDTLELNTSSSSLPQLWSSSGDILSGQSSALCQVKFSNPGMNNVQLSYSNGTCTSDTLSKSIFVAPEQKAPEIKCETIGNTILFSWQDIECTKSYEVWRDGEIIQSSTQNEYLAASIKKGETIEISLITNSNCSCPIPATAKSCTLDENDDCDMELRDDYYSIVINQPYSFDILINDFIPYDSFTVNILEYDDDYIKDLQFRESLEATVFKPFFDTLTIKYEVCTPDCNECNQAAVKITNEVLKDIIFTNIILPNSSGDNAMLRFTKDEMLKDSELYIFNRNGDRIFHMKDYDNSWNADGYPGGIYFYVLRYKGVDIKKTLTVMK